MTLAQFFHLQQSPRAILIGGRAEGALRKPFRTVMLADAGTRRGETRDFRRLLNGLIALRKHGTKK